MSCELRAASWGDPCRANCIWKEKCQHCAYATWLQLVLLDLLPQFSVAAWCLLAQLSSALLCAALLCSARLCSALVATLKQCRVGVSLISCLFDSLGGSLSAKPAGNQTQAESSRRCQRSANDVSGNCLSPARTLAVRVPKKKKTKTKTKTVKKLCKLSSARDANTCAHSTCPGLYK